MLFLSSSREVPLSLERPRHENKFFACFCFIHLRYPPLPSIAFLFDGWGLFHVAIYSSSGSSLIRRVERRRNMYFPVSFIASFVCYGTKIQLIYSLLKYRLSKYDAFLSCTNYVHPLRNASFLPYFTSLLTMTHVQLTLEYAEVYGFSVVKSTLLPLGLQTARSFRSLWA